MKFDILTIFPDFFTGPMQHGIVRRAQESGLTSIAIHDLRSFAHDRHRTVDDRTFGGGEGMVLKPEPIFECADGLGLASQAERKSGAARQTVILLTPSGEVFNQKLAEDLARLERVALICGRYEGVDERVGEHLADRQISVGDFVLSGGELAAAIIVDAVTRLLPGALGNEVSSQQESFSSHQAPEQGAKPESTCASGGLLDYPHYTRPAEYRGMQVPEVLGSGNHEAIRRWRRGKALEKTWRYRPELLRSAGLSGEDQKMLQAITDDAEAGRADLN